MNQIISLIIVWLVTAIALYIVSKLPTGVEIDSFGKAMVSAAVFGLVNAVLQFIATPFNWITFGLFSWVINIVVFALAAWLVQGFRLRWGILSAIIGAIALAIITSLIRYGINTFIFPIVA
ncbi:phage holin family protein [Gloeocapsa sp. PCC 73106]|uniref:phage holin family protein n=1 Tax=Gloeocapsa sp. PCC 73106 TaxID=102232 RepID=UPI0002ABC1CF|nr:phage holin family protein [Gloeocapsa sp. PCC 73106]ELR99860.1 putative membrane protein [Gloeocapsa sp. PCC 73106]